MFYVGVCFLQCRAAITTLYDDRFVYDCAAKLKEIASAGVSHRYRCLIVDICDSAIRVS